MILLYTENISARLSYSCHFILKEQLGVEYIITNKKEDCSNTVHFIINYSATKIESPSFQIIPHGLLAEKGIKEQEINCFLVKDTTAFFKSTDDVGFDVFAATFYLISRYEEYLPHQKDVYGRYAHENAVAFKNNFLDKPVVNIWMQWLAESLQGTFPDIKFYRPEFKTMLTYDIDMAWSYRHKGIIRNIGGFIAKPSFQRLLVLLGFKKDPYDSYEFLNISVERKELTQLYFFLVAKRLSKYDKNISPNRKPMKRLIREQAKIHSIGLHPSWLSNRHNSILIKEKKKLEKIAGNPIVNSRQHYINFNLPETFQQLLASGIQNEFSMGYGSINGFRASVASSFFWYDLSIEKTTTLRLFPFCFMDANSYYEQKQHTEDSLKELMHYKKQCEDVNGLLIPIFHNNFLGDDEAFQGWQELYTKFIASL